MSCSSSQNRIEFFPQVRLQISLARCSENKGFAVVLGVWKVLAPLLHHLLNGVSAVSSWLEFVAGAYLLSHYMLYLCASVKSLHLQIFPFSKLHFHSHDSMVT